MIRRNKGRDSNQVKVSFVLPIDDARLPASVVGDFNDWTAGLDAFKMRNNGTYSAVVTLERDRRYSFRYRGDDGCWFNEEEPDLTEKTEFGSENCVLLT